ncbi:MAG: hypothetical protein JST59_00145 [Actinobacteria bacterium]|nr:hypothetical protein [Actinomycetota bacterium]
MLTFQHERQRKSLEESLRRLELRNNDLTADVKRLNDQLADQQLSYEEQIRSNINRVREEEQRKYNASLLGLEQKLRTSDGIRDSLQKKNQELLRQLQDKESSLSYMGVDRS